MKSKCSCYFFVVVCVFCYQKNSQSLNTFVSLMTSVIRLPFDYHVVLIGRLCIGTTETETWVTCNKG